jgi:hypothetical protein
MKTIDLKSFLIGLLLAGSILLFVSSSQDSVSSSGRYQIVNITSSYLTNTAFILDTHTGAVVKIYIDESISSKTDHIPATMIREAMEKEK